MSNTLSKNDRAALDAALDMIEVIVTDQVFSGCFGPTKDKLVALNAARRKRQRIADLEAELRKLRADT